MKKIRILLSLITFWVGTSSCVTAQSTPADSHPKRFTLSKSPFFRTMLSDDGIGEWGFAALVEADSRKNSVRHRRAPQHRSREIARELKIDLQRRPGRDSQPLP